MLNQLMHPYMNIKTSLQPIEKEFTVRYVLLGSYHWGHSTVAQHHSYTYASLNTRKLILHKKLESHRLVQG